MNTHALPPAFSERVEFAIPEFDSRPKIILDMTKIKIGENRLVESRLVNGATYSDLEYTFNEGYREARKHLTTIGYEITRAKKRIEDVKSILILDKYPAFLKENKMKDNATIRDAFLQKDADYVAAKDRLDMLNALESLMDGKIKVFENVCRYMRKEMDIQNRSGINGNKYIR